MIRSLTHEEIDALDCCLRTGVLPARLTVCRMMATIRDLQRELRQQASRITAEREAAGRPEPGTIRADVTSRAAHGRAAAGRRRA